MYISLLFIDVSLGGVVREEGDRCAEAVAVLGPRGCVGQVLHRADVLGDDVAVVDGVVNGAQLVRTWRARALTSPACVVA